MADNEHDDDLVDYDEEEVREGGRVNEDRKPGIVVDTGLAAVVRRWTSHPCCRGHFTHFSVCPLGFICFQEVADVAADKAAAVDGKDVKK